MGVAGNGVGVGRVIGDDVRGWFAVVGGWKAEELLQLLKLALGVVGVRSFCGVFVWMELPEW